MLSPSLRDTVGRWRRPDRRRPAAGRRAVSWLVAGLAVTLLALPAIAEAQRPPTDRARASMRRVAAPRKQSFSADAGYVSTTGNTSVTTVNVGQRFNLTTGFWRFEQFVQVVYGESEETVNSSFIRGAMGGEYAIRNALGVAAGLLFDQNRFSGVRQRSEAYLGLVWRVIEGERDTLRLDAGGSLTEQRNVDGSRRQFPAARTAIWYKRGLAPKAFVTQSVELVPNIETAEDYRVNAVAALVSPISRSLALRVEYQVRYDNLPEPTFQTTDRIFTTGIQVSF
jgi:putative salt-induced outer membrane protein YdiY